MKAREMKLRKKLPRIVLLLAFGIVIGLFLFNFRKLSRIWNNHTVPAEVVAEAKRHVKAPSFPPRPQGSVDVEYEDLYVEVPVPEVTVDGLIPKITMRTQRTLVGRVPRPVPKPAPSEAVAAWQAETARLNEEYEGELQDKTNEIQVRLCVLK